MWVVALHIGACILLQHIYSGTVITNKIKDATKFLEQLSLVHAMANKQLIALYLLRYIMA